MKFPAGSRVIVDLYDELRPATVMQVVDFTNRAGRFFERRVVLLDEPVADWDVEKRWNVPLHDLSEPQRDGP